MLFHVFSLRLRVKPRPPQDATVRVEQRCTSLAWPKRLAVDVPSMLLEFEATDKSAIAVIEGGGDAWLASQVVSFLVALP